MENTLTSIKQIVAGLKHRCGLYTGTDTSYDNIVSFILGFSAAESVYGTKRIIDGFSEWFDHKREFHSSLHWKAIIRDEIAEGDEQKAIGELFSLFEEYLAIFLVSN